MLKYFTLICFIFGIERSFSQTKEFASFPDKREMNAFKNIDLSDNFYHQVNNYLLSYLNAENDRDSCCMTESSQYNASKFERKFFKKHAHMFCLEVPDLPTPPAAKLMKTYFRYQGYGKYELALMVERGEGKRLDFNSDQVNFQAEPRINLDSLNTNDSYFGGLPKKVVNDPIRKIKPKHTNTGVLNEVQTPVDTNDVYVDKDSLREGLRIELPYADAPSEIKKSIDSIINNHQIRERTIYIALHKGYEKAMEMFVQKFKLWKQSKTEVIIDHIAETNVAPGYRVDPEVTLISNQDMIIILFRGTDYVETGWTEFTRGNIEWLTNADANLIKVPGVFRGKVHRGFWAGLSLLTGDIMKFLRENNQDKRKPVFISGHSLGGAQAILFSYFLSEKSAGYKIRTYVYGAPAFVGDEECGKLINRHLKSRIQRFEFRNDVVPRIPNAVNPGINLLIKEVFYKCGTRNVFGTSNSLSRGMPEITTIVPLFDPDYLNFYTSLLSFDKCDIVQEFGNVINVEMNACHHNPDFYAIAAHNQLTQALKDQLPSLSGCANRSQFRKCCNK